MTSTNSSAVAISTVDLSALFSCLDLNLKKLRIAVAEQYGITPDKVEIERRGTEYFVTMLHGVKLGLAAVNVADLIEVGYVPAPAEIIDAKPQQLDPASQTGDFHLPDYIVMPRVRPNLVEETINACLLSNSTRIADEAKEADEYEAIHPTLQHVAHLETIVYHYPAEEGDEDIEVEVDGPVYLTVTAEGGHHITCADRVGMSMSPGWSYFEAFPKAGHACFTGHPSVDTIETPSNLTE